ncbi:phosphoglycerate mutase-like protein [Xylariaceae sp. FL1019]|nr:phosphoglycerate mutase-like protein [Xylariaceae sp. FL1019]
MRVLLIRHGESVDNVAGLYAGSRDSALTNHGVLQAKRLGAHLAAHAAGIGPIRHVLASDLKRAFQTAEAVRDAYRTSAATSTSPLSDVVRIPELREKDFGLLEGKKFTTREKDDGAETTEQMRLRIERFLDLHFTPILDQYLKPEGGQHYTIVIVSHGIILNVLLRAMLARYPMKYDMTPESKRFAPQVGARVGSDYHVAWSNTGYVQASLKAPTSEFVSSDTVCRWHMAVEAVNCVDHLVGLKKTRGGIGSAKFDSKQRTMDSFFASSSKKRKSDVVEE